MRIGSVIGRVTLSEVVPSLEGARWLVVSPLHARPVASRFARRSHGDQPAQPRGLRRSRRRPRTNHWLRRRPGSRVSIRKAHPGGCHQRRLDRRTLLLAHFMKQVITARDVEERVRQGKTTRISRRRPPHAVRPGPDARPPGPARPLRHARTRQHDLRQNSDRRVAGGSRISIGFSTPRKTRNSKRKFVTSAAGSGSALTSTATAAMSPFAWAKTWRSAPPRSFPRVS